MILHHNEQVRVSSVKLPLSASHAKWVPCLGRLFSPTRCTSLDFLALLDLTTMQKNNSTVVLEVFQNRTRLCHVIHVRDLILQPCAQWRGSNLSHCASDRGSAPWCPRPAISAHITSPLARKSSRPAVCSNAYLHRRLNVPEKLVVAVRMS